MQNRRYNQLTGQEKMAFTKMLALALSVVFVFGIILSSHAKAENMNDWQGWPKQSRAERLGTFTYVYGGAGFASHSGTETGRTSDTDGYARNIGGIQEAVEDSDDMVVSGGFGVRLPNEINLEFGLAILNGAYDQPDTTGNSSPKPDQPVFEMSVLKSFKWGGPTLLRYTARLGFASIDDPKTDDSTFFGIGVAHEPFRVELRNYDFGVFESQVLQVSYIYDF